MQGIKKIKKIESKIEDKQIVNMKQLQIANAASEEFAKKGYHSTSMRDIAARAGMNLSYIYQFISSKDDILYLFYRDMHKKWREEVYLKVAELDYDNPIEELKYYIRSMLIFSVKNKDKFLSLYTECRHLEKESLYAVLYESTEIIAYLEELLKRANRKSVLKISDSYITANIIQFLLAIIPLRGWNFSDDYTFDQVVEFITDFILNASGATGMNSKNKHYRKRISPAIFQKMP